MTVNEKDLNQKWLRLTLLLKKYFPLLSKLMVCIIIYLPDLLLTTIILNYYFICVLLLNLLLSFILELISL